MGRKIPGNIEIWHTDEKYGCPLYPLYYDSSPAGYID
jgi:hypothetical protein